MDSQPEVRHGTRRQASSRDFGLSEPFEHHCSRFVGSNCSLCFGPRGRSKVAAVVRFKAESSDDTSDTVIGLK